jgi:hypothetical protein
VEEGRSFENDEERGRAKGKREVWEWYRAGDCVLVADCWVVD